MMTLLISNQKSNALQQKIYIPPLIFSNLYHAKPRKVCVCEQCKPWLIWSGSVLFTSHMTLLKNKSANANGLFPNAEMNDSIRDIHHKKGYLHFFLFLFIYLFIFFFFMKTEKAEIYFNHFV